MILRIDITAERIALGNHDCLGCPGALAVLAELPVGTSVAVWPDRVVIDGRPCATPPEFGAWVRTWDAGEAVGPLRCELDTDAPYVPLWRRGIGEPVTAYVDALLAERAA